MKMMMKIPLKVAYCLFVKIYQIAKAPPVIDREKER